MQTLFVSSSHPFLCILPIKSDHTNLSAMGSSSSSFDEEACPVHKRNLWECKRQIGLEPRDPYPASGYQGQCGEFEYLLKKCFAFKFCDQRGDARRVYDHSSPRSERVESNKQLQKCLLKVNQFKESIPIPTKPKYDR